MSEIFKAAVLGIVEGITEWLPVSSTGHMILVDEFLRLNASEGFMELFLVAIQLGAIIAVVILYWRRLVPVSFADGVTIKRETVSLWLKIIVACVPAAVIGFLFDDKINELFFNYQTVAGALIVYGVLFIAVERGRGDKPAAIDSVERLDYKTALLIGAFQVLSLIPGTSRSGATILGAVLLGTSRTVAAEFTFYLGIPIMFGASVLKLYKFGLAFTGEELAVLLTGAVTALAVSVLAIKFLISYVRKHDFTAFGIYRIVLGAVVLGYFWITA